MTTMTTALRRAWIAVRWSMAVQISVSIAFISVALILVSGLLMERVFVTQLRTDNELALISDLAFFHDEVAAGSFDPRAGASTGAAWFEDRMHRLDGALYDESGRRLSSSPSFPFDELPPGPVVDVDALARDLKAMPGRDRVHALYAPYTRIVNTAAGERYRTLVGRVALPGGDVDGPSTVTVALAVRTSSMALVRRDRVHMLWMLGAAVVLAVVLGTVVAGRIVAGARRLGTAASRIGAEALDERLSLDATPTELVESTLAFNRMLDRLQMSFHRLSAFSSDLAHDLRTPINNLLGEAQVALSRPRTPDEYRAVIESSVEEYERLSRMIGNMLFLARADHADAVVTPVALRTSDVLGRVLSYFELIADERGIGLALAIGPDDEERRTVYADEELLVRAVSNLVSNGLRHAAPGSQVLLDARTDATGGCRIAVANHGAPIPLALQARIFERFYRGDASREDSSSSSGLGLAIVQSIMRLHRGTVTVTSAAGAKTTFTLAFPGPASSGEVRA